MLTLKKLQSICSHFILGEKLQVDLMNALNTNGYTLMHVGQVLNQYFQDKNSN